MGSAAIGAADLIDATDFDTPQIIRLGTAEEDFSFHLEQENLDLIMDKVRPSWLID